MSTVTIAPTGGSRNRPHGTGFLLFHHAPSVTVVVVVVGCEDIIHRSVVLRLSVFVRLQEVVYGHGTVGTATEQESTLRAVGHVQRQHGTHVRRKNLWIRQQRHVTAGLVLHNGIGEVLHNTVERRPVKIRNGCSILQRSGNGLPMRTRRPIVVVRWYRCDDRCASIVTSRHVYGNRRNNITLNLR